MHRHKFFNLTKPIANFSKNSAKLSKTPIVSYPKSLNIPRHINYLT